MAHSGLISSGFDTPVKSFFSNKKSRIIRRLTRWSVALVSLNGENTGGWKYRWTFPLRVEVRPTVYFLILWQAEFGDHDPERHSAEYLKDFPLLPKPMISHFEDR